MKAQAAALAAGAALSLAFAPFSFALLALLAPALLFLLVAEAPPRRAAWRGLLFGIGLFGVGVSWVFVAIHDYGNTGAMAALLLTLLFVLLLALYFALFAWAAARLPGERGGRYFLLALPALWLLVEWFRGWFLTGFPWLALGYSQIETPMAGYAPLFGIYGVSGLLVFGAGALAWGWRQRRVWPVAALLVALLGGGAALQQVAWVEPTGSPLQVSLVQGNLPQPTKWDAAQIRHRLATYRALSEPRMGRDDLVVWPENAITVFYHQIRDGYLADLEQQAQASGTDLVLGLPVQERSTGRYYTALMSLGREQAFYYKHHLVPFGEYVPLEGVLRGMVGFFDLPMSGFTPGPRQQAPLPVAGVSAAPTICYEDAFGHQMRRSLPEASILINGSNNAWYGDSLAPHQHLQIARMRSLETGRPLLRATTNGISALVDHRGRLAARSRQFEQDLLSGEVQPMGGATPYVRWGDWPVVGLALLLFVLAMQSGRRRRVRR